MQDTHYIPPVVNVNPPLAMNVQGDHKSNYHMALMTVSHGYNTMPHGEFLSSRYNELLQILKHAKGEAIDIAAFADLVADATQLYQTGADPAVLDSVFNLVLIDHHVYKSRLYFVPVDATDEESAGRYVETFSVLIGAGVNRIIRQMAEARGQTVATHAEVKTVVTQEAVQHQPEESDSFSPVIIDARQADNGSWCVLMVLLDDVEALPDPIVTGMLSVVRESIEAFMDQQRPAPDQDSVQKTDPPPPSNSEGVEDAIPANASC